MNTQEVESRAIQSAVVLGQPILTVALLIVCSFAGPRANSLLASDSLFDPPPAPIAGDEVLLISTRRMGLSCDADSMQTGLDCHRVIENAQGEVVRARFDWRELISSKSHPTIVYVHGNRVSEGHDVAEGLAFYRSFRKLSHYGQPVRFIIFSWPASQIPGPIKDYLVKARRTNPVAWQLAWLLDRMPMDTPISLVGYSYGARVVSGTSHLLAGGTIGPLKLTERVHPGRPPIRAALIAAAFDADWIQPGNYFSRTLAQTERLVLGVNRWDPAMRFYHLSNGRGRMDALGKEGVYRPESLSSLADRVKRLDFSQSVGRSHVVTDYLAAEGQMTRIWSELLMPATRAESRAQRRFVSASL